MQLLEILSVASSGVVIILASVITGYLGGRVGKLEDRIDTLEDEVQVRWKRERQLIDFIYRNKLQPPKPEEYHD